MNTACEKNHKPRKDDLKQANPFSQNGRRIDIGQRGEEMQDDPRLSLAAEQKTGRRRQPARRIGTGY